MKAKTLIFQIMLPIALLCCWWVVLFVINLKYEYPKLKDPVQITKLNMTFMADTVKYAMKATGHSNAVEYVAHIAGTQNSLQILSRDTIRQILRDGREYPFDLENGVFLDGWEHPIMITLTTNQYGELGIMMHSFGKNKRNENGAGDDIVIWFNADMSPMEPRSFTNGISSANSKFRNK